jgi:hypothetical protein
MRSKPNKLCKESMKQKVCSLKKIDKLLANMTKQRREKTQINRIRDEKRDITTNINKIQKIIREYFETYIKKNWKIYMKWINSSMHATNQN